MIPDLGDLVIEERVGDELQFLAHDDESLQCFLYIHKVLLHDFQQPVVADDFLHKHCIHRFLVAGRVLLLDFVDGQHLWGLGLHEAGNVADDFFSGLSGTTSRPRLH